MPRHHWSLARLMAGMAILAVSLATLKAFCPRQGMTNDEMIALILALALVLTAGADRVLFGRKYRVFWLGFTAAGWLCAATALTDYQDTTTYLRRHGPPLVREHVRYQQRLAWAMMRRLPPPQVPEWYLLVSRYAELSWGLALEVLVASAGGLFASSAPLIARQAARLAQWLNLPDPMLHQRRPVVTRESHDP